MSGKIIFKKSSVADKEPTVNDLEYGELAINYADEKLFYKNSSNNIVELSGSGGGGIASIQGGFINASRHGTTGNIAEDSSYYDIDLTQSPYTPVDPDKSIVVFEGGYYAAQHGMHGGGTGFYNACARIEDSGNTVRISSPGSWSESGYYFVGRWRLVEAA